MTREEMIKLIYQKIGEIKKYNDRQICLYCWNIAHWEYWYNIPVMIWDVMDYFEKNNLSDYIDWVTFDDYWNLYEFDNFLIQDWKEKRKPIEEQSDDCIKFVFDLLPKE